MTVGVVEDADGLNDVLGVFRDNHVVLDVSLLHEDLRVVVFPRQLQLLPVLSLALGPQLLQLFCHVGENVRQGIRIFRVGVCVAGSNLALVQHSNGGLVELGHLVYDSEEVNVCGCAEEFTEVGVVFKSDEFALELVGGRIFLRFEVLLR